MPSIADIKNRARRSIHGRAAVPCLLTDPTHPTGLLLPEDGPVLTVRYHTKLDTTGGLDGDYGEVIDGIDRLVFFDDNVADVSAALVAAGEAPLILQRGALVTIPAYKGLRFTLDNQEPPDGPAETAWAVARSRG